MDQTDSQNLHSHDAEDGSGGDAANLYYDVGASPRPDGDWDYQDEPDEVDEEGEDHGTARS
ncbi:hypothetical protein E4U55_002054 [Claviceps digitariae]|nr:hypothetical protein E4U55_002054 [Claviceps digitariae]